MQPYFETDGITLHYLSAGRWLAEGELLRGLPTRLAGPRAGAQCRRLDAGRAQAAAAAPPAKRNADAALHPPGQRRAGAQRLLPVNSFWISGTGALPAKSARPTPPARRPSSQPAAPRSLAQAVFKEDWAACAQAWAALDAGEIAALLARQRAGETRAAHAVRRTQRADLRNPPRRPVDPDFKPFQPFAHAGRARAAMKIIVTSLIAHHENPYATFPRAASGRWSRPAFTRCWRACTPRAACMRRRTRRRPGPPAAARRRMKGAHEAAVLLADAIAADKKLCIVADYDCDGATACAVALRGLRLLGAQHVSYIVPDRVVDGYGLTAPIAERVKDSGADVLITVDNGIASIDGVASATRAGPAGAGDRPPPARAVNEQIVLPDADVIVNPNQPGCSFREQVDRRRRRDVLRAAGAARRTAPARRVRRGQPAQARRAAAAGGAGHRGRRGQARRQQPPPGGAGPEARPRRRPAAGHGRLFTAAGAQGAMPPPPSTSALRSARASTPPGGWPT